MNTLTQTPLDARKPSPMQIAATLVALAILILYVIAYQNFEDTSESWGYWFFANQLTRNFQSVIVDRGPVYVAYLSLFSWIGYPLSVDSATFVSIFTFSLAFILFFTPSSSFLVITICVAIWLPYIRQAEPMAQFLGFSLVIFTEIWRRSNFAIFRQRVWYSYPVLLCAYFCRPSLIIFFLLYVIYDLRVLVQDPRRQTTGLKRDTLLHLFVVFLSLALLLLYVSRQSASSWNNVWFTDTLWFPNQGKSLLDGGGIQSLNWMYNQLTFGTSEGRDFYFTQKELFGGRTTYFDAVLFRPDLFIKVILANLYELAPTLTHMVFIPFVGRYNLLFLKVIFLIYIFLSAYFFCVKERCLILFFGSIIVLLSCILNVPKDRYIFPMVFLNMASAIQSYRIFVPWIFRQLKSETSNNNFVKIFFRNCLRQKWHSSLIILMIFSFYSGMNIRLYYLDIVKNAFGIQNERHSALPLRGGFPELVRYSRDCAGIMALESAFFGAFAQDEHQQVFSVFEIPPFGTLHSGEYFGFENNRIDCVFISDQLATSVGSGTTVNTRYKDYIFPYSREMLIGGGVEVDIPHYGRLVKSPK